MSVAQELNTQQDLGKIPLSEEQAKRIMELYEAKRLQDVSDPTLGDLAEALNIPVDQAAELLRESEVGQSKLADAHVPKTGRKWRPITPREMVYVGVLFVVAIAVLVWSSSLGRHSNGPAVYPNGVVVTPPISSESITPLVGFTVEVACANGSTTWPETPKPIEYIRKDNQEGLRRSIEKDIAKMVEQQMSSGSSFEAGNTATLSISTEAGKISFKVRALRSAFPLNPSNPSTQKLMADIHDGLAKNWDKLVPPK